MNSPQENSRRGISLAEYADRRQQVFKALKGAAAVIFAGEGSPPLLGQWRPDFHFLYLTGIDDEPGAAVLFNPAAEDPKRAISLFLRPLGAVGHSPGRKPWVPATEAWFRPLGAGRPAPKGRKS